MSDEILDIVNEKGEIIGSAIRDVIHNDNSLLHRVVHLLLFNSKGQLLLQKRSMSKDIAPGTWDTSVGGHVARGENINKALKREMEEELFLNDWKTEFLYTYVHRNKRESEVVYSFKCICDGTLEFNQDEITEIRFWDLQDIVKQIHTDLFSNNFKDEFRRYMDYSMH